MYNGPNPKDINKFFPEHTYELIVCLLNGDTKKRIQKNYLKTIGHTRDSYQQLFPGAPMSSMSDIDLRTAIARTEEGRAIRSKNLTKLNLTGRTFQEHRIQSVNEFLSSERSTEYRKNQSNRAKEQHQNGQADFVRNYFKTIFVGSEDQKNRSIRMKTNNPGSRPEVIEKGKATYIKNHNSGFHATAKNQFKNYDLQYQSSYEKHFLEYCEDKGIIQHVTRALTFKDSIYPRRYYLPDYILYGEYVVEIKSWYIEKKQETLRPGITEEKSSLIERSGYKWLYLVDFNYTELDRIIMTR